MEKTRASSPGLGPRNLTITEKIEAECDVAIEFTWPPGFRATLAWCVEAQVPLVSGTTGLLTEADLIALDAAAYAIPVLWSPNMSVGINLLSHLVSEAAQRLGSEWETEICESHHDQKVDAPSGTARELLKAVCAVRDVNPIDAVVYGRYGQCGPRPPGEIGMHALRLGNNVGEHEIHFGYAGEVLTLRHRALARDIFAAGALRAAEWLVAQRPGLYHMRDVLHLR